MSAFKISINDAFLFTTLVYASLDIFFEWDRFEQCSRPIHWWLLASYVMVIWARFMHLLGRASEAREDFLMDMRSQKKSTWVLTRLMWTLNLPLFGCWTLLGTWWLQDVRSQTSECFPGSEYVWFVVAWQVLGYVWVATYVALAVAAWRLESRVRQAEADLRQLEDPDLVERWGADYSQLSSYRSLPRLLGKETGLKPADIGALPGRFEYCGQCGVADECSICLNAFKEGDSVRQLPSCRHSFHRSCIDLWLVRSADCPLCKCKVESESDYGTCPGKAYLF